MSPFQILNAYLTPMLLTYMVAMGNRTIRGLVMITCGGAVRNEMHFKYVKSLVDEYIIQGDFMVKSDYCSGGYSRLS
jgi:hypothetical protein